MSIYSDRRDALAKHKLCPIHGAKYLLVSDPFSPAQTGFCGHPTCIDKVINSATHMRLCGGLVKFCKRLDKERGQDDFSSFVTQQLLVEASKNKPTILNPFFMKWTCLAYLTQLKKEEDREKVRGAILKQINSVLEEEVSELISTIGVGALCSKSPQFDPDRLVFQNEIIGGIINSFGKETYLWLIGELTDLDCCKIRGISPADLPKLKKEVKNWYINNTK